jgi:hypothetical protein
VSSLVTLEHSLLQAWARPKQQEASLSQAAVKALPAAWLG